MKTRIKKDIDAISFIRSNNNDLWMEILAIACQAAPDKVVEILSAIRMNDMRITDQLTDLEIALIEQQKAGVLAD